MMLCIQDKITNTKLLNLVVKTTKTLKLKSQKKCFDITVK